MATSANTQDGPDKQVRSGNAFLLAQLGAHATGLFAERIATLDLAPAQAGLLRIVAIDPGLSQQVIAERLGTPPSRLVPLIDGLEKRGVVERRRNPADRRNHALYLTAEGGRLMGRLGQVAAAHEDAICGPLDPDERTQLGTLLRRLAADQGLQAGTHPGYAR
jgi:DNA-binding MarR family transcriptional regulator